MTSMDTKTLGARIREARKRAGISQDDLGRAISLERSMIAKIESGLRKVTALELADIAARIGVRMSTFFEDPLPALVQHRSSQGLDTAESNIDGLLSSFAGDVEFIASLGVTELGLSGAEKVDAASIARPRTVADAEALAETARELMALASNEPIRNLSGKVAGIGLLVFSRDIGKDTADAGTIMLRQGGVSLINSYMKVGRRRLALAHELGHFLLTDGYTIDWRVNDRNVDVPAEARLDRFARSLLLPRAAVEQLWTQWVAQYDERTAAIMLASDFQVDMATLAVRLKELRLANGASVAEVFEYRTTQADIIDLNLIVPPEEMAATTIPLPFARAVLRLVRDERISRDRALQLLQGTFDEVDLPPIRERRRDEIWNFVS